jgi:hypothetical protein
LFELFDALVPPLRQSNRSAEGQSSHNFERRGSVHHEAAPVETAKPGMAAATEALLMAAEDRGPLMHAHIGMMLALHGAKPIPEYDSSKEKHWRRRKLKRDE